MFAEKTSVLKRLKEAVHPTPLRERITTALHKLKVQQRRLERTCYQLQGRDKAVHDKCVAALQVRNNQLAEIYANECAEIRKIAKITLHSELALEHVTIRLETVKEFGDVVHTMAPVVAVVGKVKNQLQAVLPDISMQLSEVNESLQTMVEEVGEAGEESFDLGISNEDAEKILTEANLVAEQKMKEKFPEIPDVQAHEAHT